MQGDPLEVGAKKCVKMKFRSHDLQDSCHIKRRKVPESVSEVVGLVVVMVDIVALETLPGAASSCQPRIEQLMQDSSRTKIKVVSLTAKVDKLEGKRDETRCLHEELVQFLRVGAKKSE